MATTDIHMRTSSPSRRKWIHTASVKVVFAVCLGVLLLAAGLKGRQHAMLLSALDGITQARDQLQDILYEGREPAKAVASEAIVTAGPLPASPPAPTTPEGNLRTLLTRFDSEYRRSELSDEDSLQIRLSHATLANAGERFADALTTITDEDGKKTDAAPRVFRVRGDAFFGLRQWGEALNCYRKTLQFDPDHPAAKTRAAECLAELGNTAEAWAAYSGLVSTHSHRGDALLARGKADAAARHYEKAAEILTRLIEIGGRKELARELAMSHNRGGDAFLLQGNLDAAVGHYEKALAIRTRLGEQNRSQGAGDLPESLMKLSGGFFAQGKWEEAVERAQKAVEILAGQTDQKAFANDLAAAHTRLANTLFAHGKPAAAIEDYTKAIELQSRLIAQESSGDVAAELARNHNNRGAAHAAGKEQDAAVADFTSALDVLTHFKGQSSAGMTRAISVRLDVTMSYSRKGPGVLTRVRLSEQDGLRTAAIVEAVSHRNRGQALLSLGKTDPGLGDLDKGREIFARLVEQEGQADLASEFAASLASLAAACAGTGGFSDAIKWQQKALEYAPAQERQVFTADLERYKSGKP
ncbi:MAG TPA: tetratricopeptide repeat protein [Verrucomicrobiales bacterium]|nr:tetratricopeptide repeat protein [Verrucomicrobiales bacterium]